MLFLVEYPTVLYGTFDERSCTFRRMCMITSMREHQRYFPVLNAERQLQAVLRHRPEMAMRPDWIKS